jgi:hypothetical protein
VIFTRCSCSPGSIRRTVQAAGANRDVLVTLEIDGAMCACVQGKRWVEKLLCSEYNALTLEERMEAITDLMHLALDMPSMRAALDKRIEDVDRVKKHMREEAKVERRNRQLEMAKKAKRDADDVAARVATLREELASTGVLLHHHGLVSVLH